MKKSYLKRNNKRFKLLKILETHQALDDFNLLQEKKMFNEKIEISKISNNLKKYHDIDDEKDRIKEKKLILSEKIKR